MKRLILSLLLALLVAPIVIGQQPSDIIIGVVTYQFEGRVWDVENYTNPVNTDLQILPVDYGDMTRALPTVEPVHYLVDIRQAATAAEQIAAIESLMAANVAALVITPVTEGVEPLKAAIQAAAAKVPVVLHGYKVAGLNLPFAGMDLEELAKNMAQANTRPRSFVIIGNLSEYNQKTFIEILQGNAGFKGFYEAGDLDGQAEAAMAIRDVADLWGIVVTNSQFAPGAAEAIKAATAGTDRLIKLGSVGAPEDWKSLFDQKLLSAAFTFDSYQTLQQAAVMAKIMLTGGTLENFYPDVLFYTRSNAYNHTSWPYSLDTPNRLASFWN